MWKLKCTTLNSAVHQLILMSIIITSYRKVSSEPRSLILDELKVGEQLLWVGVPNPLVFACGWGRAGLLLLIILPMLAFSGFMIHNALFLTGTLPNATFVTMFVAGLLELFQPVWDFVRAKKIAYAITSRRVLIADAGGLRLDPGDNRMILRKVPKSVRSFEIELLRSLQCEQRANGSGNLSFNWRESSDARGDHKDFRRPWSAFPVSAV